MRTNWGNAAYKNKTEQEHYLNITLAKDTFSSTAMVYFYKDATPAFDPAYDANRLSGAKHIPFIYSLEQSGERLAYNAFPTLQAGVTQSVPVGLYDAKPGNLSLEFEGINSLNATVLLEDLKLNTTTTVTDGFVYNFTTTAGDSRDRFVLHFNANPVSGITQLSKDLVHLYPNPTNGTVALVLNDNHGFAEATITNLSGITVQSHKLSESNSQLLNTSELPAGIYFITISGADTQTLKLIKQ